MPDDVRAGGRSGAPARPGLPDAYAVLAPGASCPSRRYPPERFAAVARDLGLPVAVVGTEKERALVRSVTAGTPGVVDLSGLLDVPALVATIADARLAVTNNSGGMHMADAVGTPVVALFAGTEDESQFAPRSVPATLLRVPDHLRAVPRVRLPVRPRVPRHQPRRRGGRRPRARRVRVLTWHVHGSYLWYLSQVPVTWVLPVRPGGRRGLRRPYAVVRLARQRRRGAGRRGRATPTSTSW